MKALPFVLGLLMLAMEGFAQNSSKSGMHIIKPDSTIEFEMMVVKPDSTFQSKMIVVKPDSLQQFNMPVRQPELHTFPSPLQLRGERNSLPNTLLKRSQQ